MDYHRLRAVEPDGTSQPMGWLHGRMDFAEGMSYPTRKTNKNALFAKAG